MPRRQFNTDSNLDKCIITYYVGYKFSRANALCIHCICSQLMNYYYTLGTHLLVTSKTPHPVYFSERGLLKFLRFHSRYSISNYVYIYSNWVFFSSSNSPLFCNHLDRRAANADCTQYQNHYRILTAVLIQRVNVASSDFSTFGVFFSKTHSDASLIFEGSSDIWTSGPLRFSTYPVLVGRCARSPTA